MVRLTLLDGSPGGRRELLRDSGPSLLQLRNRATWDTAPMAPLTM
jgi:hypothetical protein